MFSKAVRIHENIALSKYHYVANLGVVWKENEYIKEKPFHIVKTKIALKRENAKENSRCPLMPIFFRSHSSPIPSKILQTW